MNIVPISRIEALAILGYHECWHEESHWRYACNCEYPETHFDWQVVGHVHA